MKVVAAISESTRKFAKKHPNYEKDIVDSFSAFKRMMEQHYK